MADMNDINMDGVVDTTKGKVTVPYEGKNNPFADIPDDAQVSSSSTESAPLPNNQIVPKHVPMLDDPKPGEPTEAEQPTMRAIKRPIRAVTKDTVREKPPEMKEFDISSLPPKKQEESQASREFQARLINNLDTAVEREKQSITQRTQDILEKQKEEADDLYRRGIITKKDEENVDKDIEGYDGGTSADKNQEAVDTSSEPEKEVHIENGESAPVQRVTQTPTPAAPTVVDEDEELGEYEAETRPEFMPPPGLTSDNPNTKFSDAELDADLAKELGEPVEESQEDTAHRLGNEVRLRTQPYKNKIDLNSFEVDTNNKIVNIEDHLSISSLSTADWVLPGANRVAIFSALSGPEMLALNPNRSAQNRVNTMRSIYNIIYQHIVSEKPATFDEWVRTTRFSDLDHHYFGLFKATFAGSNFMNYTCDGCGHTFIHDMDFDDYVVYSDKKSEEAMKALLHSGDTSIAPYDIHRCQIDDTYVVDLRNPSIQDTILDVAGLSETFVSKYEDLMDILVYIDNVYRINYETHKLEPVDMKPDPNNHNKSVARRISILNKILNKLSTDAYYELRRNMVLYFPNNNSISFQIPACTCEKCGKEIKARTQGVEAQTLLFMRHQLGAFVIL